MTCEDFELACITISYPGRLAQDEWLHVWSTLAHKSAMKIIQYAENVVTMPTLREGERCREEAMWDSKCDGDGASFRHPFMRLRATIHDSFPQRHPEQCEMVGWRMRTPA